MWFLHLLYHQRLAGKREGELRLAKTICIVIPDTAAVNSAKHYCVDVRLIVHI